VDLALNLMLGEIVAKGVGQGAVFVRFGDHDRHIIGFVDDEQVFIFVHDIERDVLMSDGLVDFLIGNRHFQGIAFFYGIKIGLVFVIDHDLLFAFDFFDQFGRNIAFMQEVFDGFRLFYFIG